MYHLSNVINDQKEISPKIKGDEFDSYLYSTLDYSNSARGKRCRSVMKSSVKEIQPIPQKPKDFNLLSGLAVLCLFENNLKKIKRKFFLNWKNFSDRAFICKLNSVEESTTNLEDLLTCNFK
mmetsp:Transcript_16983/g.14912  ORF Transcript_16983/g.14912 Transcript_16983/m.14912 type:complete len:122 (-) Transcript_16983:3-368(-)